MQIITSFKQVNRNENRAAIAVPSTLVVDETEVRDHKDEDDDEAPPVEVDVMLLFLTHNLFELSSSIFNCYLDFQIFMEKCKDSMDAEFPDIEISTELFIV